MQAPLPITSEGQRRLRAEPIHVGSSKGNDVPFRCRVAPQAFREQRRGTRSSRPVIIGAHPTVAPIRGDPWARPSRKDEDVARSPARGRQFNRAVGARPSALAKLWTANAPEAARRAGQGPYRARSPPAVDLAARSKDAACWWYCRRVCSALGRPAVTPASRIRGTRQGTRRPPERRAHGRCCRLAIGRGAPAGYEKLGSSTGAAPRLDGIKATLAASTLAREGRLCYALSPEPRSGRHPARSPGSSGLPSRRLPQSPNRSLFNTLDSRDPCAFSR
jgi:hypothetical protein